jgi:quaternary ammonium compound-resistance protein SugE
MTSAWISLTLAAIAEAAYGIALYHSRGFTVAVPSTLSVVAGIATTILLGISMKSLPIGVAFVVWSGLAALGTAGYGMIVLGESKDLLRLALMAMILGGVAGLKFTSSH